MESMTISDVRKNLSSVVHALKDKNREPVRINLRGEDVAVIISNEEYERLRQQSLDREIDSIFAEFHDVNVALTCCSTH